ncbi:glycosyltransferase [Arthrobacter sp. CC3]|uniref:glycosyltransferase n=1 Tax=Arthrobacter sp. CC3 TaxID=3029185 RepID=UPI0032668E80
MLQTDNGHRKPVQQVFVYIPGSRWENVQGTDHRLAAALAHQVPVLWIDPPLPIHRALRLGPSALHGTTELSNVAPGITRLRSLSVPGFTRPILALAAKHLLGRAVRTALGEMGMDPLAVLLSSPSTGFPRRISGQKILFVTDDWVAGAAMMGLSGRFVHRTLRRNLREADAAAAVSPYLAESLRLRFPDRLTPVVLANGCELQECLQQVGERSANAALVGQLNERLDMDLLEAVQEAGIPVLVIGPRTDRDPAAGQRLDAFLASESVTWLGELPATELRQHLEQAGVGLTPYADTAFNRSSFPLKTLEYLAAGVPVVATDLPAVRWLNTDLVTVSHGREEFAQCVQQALVGPHDPAAEERRRHFARLHTWEARAGQLLELVGARR